jgi:hypothetical protein
LLVEPQRAREVGDDEVDVRETLGADHTRNVPLLLVQYVGALSERPWCRSTACARSGRSALDGRYPDPECSICSRALRLFLQPQLNISGYPSYG